MSTPREILKKYWAYRDFRPLQEEVISSALDGKDTLALMPTGGGKSLCYQVPALVKDGVCLVVSPLIALMKDQVFQLQKRKIPAAAIYSGMRYRDMDRLFDNAVYGQLKILYLSPERLVTELARERIKKMSVNLLAVDEAHCISQWGYDFRPSYLEIANIRSLIPDTPIMAVTATATPEVVDDIQEKLLFTKKSVFQKSFERKNLAYVVLQEENKEAKLLDLIRKINGSGIVYARNRRSTKEYTQFLQKNGIRADFYHAGLSTPIRSAKQEAWMRNQLKIMVATNAFGMGIDKANVRLVVHMDLPDSLEAYFQEAGRAGRDGHKAYAVLLYHEADKQSLTWHYENSFPSIDEVKQVYRALGSYFQLATGSGMGESFDFDLSSFTKNFKFEIFRTYSCLKILEQSGWLVLSDAVFIPSTLQIAVKKEQLYDYQLKNRALDPIIKTVLRSYQGAFSHPVKIDESQLARFLKISRAQLVQAFTKMQSEEIISYNPQKDKPQLVFLQPRVDSNNLILDQKLYNFRKKRYLARITQAINYAENPQCRSHQLLKYFGETDTQTCGMCDVCLGRTDSDLSDEEFQRYKTKIKRILLKDRLSLEELVDSFGSHRQAKVLKTLEFLMDERMVEKYGDKLVWIDE